MADQSSSSAPGPSKKPVSKKRMAAPKTDYSSSDDEEEKLIPLTVGENGGAGDGELINVDFEISDPQEIHFQIKDMVEKGVSDIENGILIDLYQTKLGVRGKKVSLITISSVTSADGNELIVKARAQ